MTDPNPRHVRAAEEAWLDQALRDALEPSASSAPDTQRAEPGLVGPHRWLGSGRSLVAAALVLAGIGVVLTVLLQGPAEPAGSRGASAPGEQDPRPEDLGPAAPPARAVDISSRDALRSWIPKIVAVRAWPLIAVDELGLHGPHFVFHGAPECAASIRDPSAVRDLCAALDRALQTPMTETREPSRAGVAFGLATGEGTEIRGTLYLDADPSFDVVSAHSYLGPMPLPDDLRRAFQPAIDRAAARARTEFAVVHGPDLDGVPRTVRRLVTYGVGDDGFAPLREFGSLEVLHVYGREPLSDPRSSLRTTLITDAFAAAMAPMPRLRSLHLTATATTAATLAELARQPNLRELTIDEAGHGGYLGPAFRAFRGKGSLTSVRVLGVHFLDADAVRSLCDVTTLTDVELGFASRKPPGWDAPGGGLLAPLARESAVRRLTVRGLQLPSGWLARPDAPAGTVGTLEYLALHGGRASLAGLQGQPQLRELHLDGVVLDSPGLRPLADGRLRDVRLANLRRPSPADWDALWTNPLDALTLYNCGLTDADLAEVVRRGVPRVLDLRGNALSRGALLELQAARPGAAIVHSNLR